MGAELQSLSEEREDVLARLVGDAECLDTELLLDLEVPHSSNSWFMSASTNWETPEVIVFRKDEMKLVCRSIRVWAAPRFVRRRGHFLDRAIDAGDVAVQRRLVGRAVCQRADVDAE